MKQMMAIIALLGVFACASIGQPGDEQPAKQTQSAAATPEAAITTGVAAANEPAPVQEPARSSAPSTAAPTPPGISTRSRPAAVRAPGAPSAKPTAPVLPTVAATPGMGVVAPAPSYPAAPSRYAAPPEPARDSAPAAQSVLATAPALPPLAGGVPAREQVSVQLEIYRIRGNISGEASLAEDLQTRTLTGYGTTRTEASGTTQSPGEVGTIDTVAGPGTTRAEARWTCPMHPEVRMPREGKCPTCGMAMMPVQTPFFLFTRADLNVAGVKLHVDEEGWTWNGRPRPPANDKIEAIASPRVILLPGERFTIGLGSQQPIQYFEPRPDGLFELKTMEEQPGMAIEGWVETHGPDRVLVRDFALALRSIEKRLPIEGVNLDVGAPLVNAREWRTSIMLQPDRDYGVQLTTEGYGFLLLRLKVQVVGPGDVPGINIPTNEPAPAEPRPAARF